MPILSSLGASSARGFGFRAKGGLPQIVLSISATTTNYNVFTSAGSPSAASEIIVNINSGVTVGATSGNTALTVGQFPTGSTITINNSGNIDGFGGAAGTSGAGGNGGDAIYADYPNQIVVINNNSGANIRGGGGGGGKGGAGGQGGPGQQTLGTADCCNCGSTSQACVNLYGTGTCFSGSSGYDKSCGNTKYSCFSCRTNTTGGAGGAGGNGGAGQGYSQSQSNGSAGSSGAAGGVNAGTGGTGGAGGNGGTFGNSGTAGATGSNGASGNIGGGSSGAAGSTFGTAGRYLVKGSSSVTLTNNGTVAGGLA